MRRLTVAAIVVVAGVFVALGVEYMAQQYDLGPSDAAGPSPSTVLTPGGQSRGEPFTTTGPATPEVASPSATGPPVPADTQPARVRYVVDGDTLEMQAEDAGDIITTEARFRVRLIGVDAPEIRPDECYGPEATEYVRNLLRQDSLVLVSQDREALDDFNRRLLYIWLPDGRMVNFEIVANGYGEALRVWPNVAYADKLLSAQKVAKQSHLGLWGAC